MDLKYGIGITLDLNLKNLLDTEAQSQNRSRSNMIEFIVKKYFEDKYGAQDTKEN